MFWVNVRSFRWLALSAAIPFAAIGLSPSSAHNQTVMAGNNPNYVTTFAATLSASIGKYQAATNHLQSAYSSVQSGNAEVKLLCLYRGDFYLYLPAIVLVLVPVDMTYTVVYELLTFAGLHPKPIDVSWWEKLCDRDPFFAQAILVLAAAGGAAYIWLVCYLFSDRYDNTDPPDEPPGDMN